MELTLPSSSRSHLLLLIVLLSLQVVHAEALRLGVWNMFHNGSRLLPKDCDQVCASELRVKRLFGAKRDVAGLQHNNRSRLSATKEPVVKTEFAENYLRVSINRQSLSLLFDTGTQLTWVQSGPSISYYNDKAAWYDRTKDTPPVRRIPAGHTFCEQLKKVPTITDPDRECGFKIVYGRGEQVHYWTRGYVVWEYMSVRDASVGDGWYKLPPIRFGFSDEGGSNMDTGVSGSMGFFKGGHGISFLEQISRKTSFSFCLPPESSPNSGFLVLEDETDPQTTPGYSTASVSAPGWFLVMTVITVDDSPVMGVPESAVGPTKIDTGSPYTKLREPAYSLLRDKWRTALESKLGTKRYEKGPLDTCYPYPTILPDIPKVGFAFGGGGATFKTNHDGNAFIYFSFNEEAQAWEQHMCWPFVALEEGAEELILGALQMLDIRVLFDFMRRQVAWSYQPCSVP